MAEFIKAGWVCMRNTVGIFVLAAVCFGGGAVNAHADEKSEVMKEFVEHQAEEHGVKAIPEKRRHQILFVMGMFLLLGLLITAGLGIAMALYGKQVFVAHMISAGFSVFLAVAHAVTAMVWFFPF